jgi:hypothetical protein
MKKIFIDTVVKENANAGSKATRDCAEILSRNGYKRLAICVQKSSPLKTFLSLAKVLFSIKPMTHILIQYPLSYRLFVPYSVSVVCKFKRCKLSILIHDIISLRGKEYCLQKEMNVLKKADNIIVHNDEMLSWLSSYIHNSRFYILQLFDYLIERPSRKSSFGNIVVFAGNLQKSAFLNRVNTLGIKMNLYGAEVENIKSICNDNVKYKGTFKSDDLSALVGNWGLVWDGTSLDSCDGIYGEYLKYNAPHKMSLYIVAGLPIIIWEQAAESKFITDNKLGIAVSSLYEVSDILKRITEVEYNEISLSTKIV